VKHCDLPSAFHTAKFWKYDDFDFITLITSFSTTVTRTPNKATVILVLILILKQRNQDLHHIPKFKIFVAARNLHGSSDSLLHQLTKPNQQT
jgi:hypothetical protein